MYSGLSQTSDVMMGGSETIVGFMSIPQSPLVAHMSVFCFFRFSFSFLNCEGCAGRRRMTLKSELQS
jgi:hypothetical protein